MATNVLSEAISSAAREARPLFEKWGKVFEKIQTRKPTFDNFEKKFALARVMENTQQFLNHRMTESVATQSSDVGQFKRFALDVLSVAIPNLIAFDLVAVQPISNRVGMVNYIEYTYNSTKGDVNSGDVFTDPWKMGDSDSKFTSRYINREVVPTGSTEYTLKWTPPISGTIYYTVAATGAKTAMSVEPDGKTVTLPGASADGDFFSYAYMNEEVPANDIPHMGLRMRSIPVEVKSRHLAVVWGFEAQYELNKEYNFDINTELSKMAAGELNHQIDLEVCEDLFSLAGSPQSTWSRDELKAGETVATHYDSFAIKLDELATKIYENTKRVHANWALVGTQVGIVIKNCRGFNAASTGALSGPYFAGTINNLKVYVSPSVDPYTYIVGYKGDSLFQAGYILCPYLPIMQSDLVTLRDMSQQKGFISLYGTVPVNPHLYAKGVITA